MINQLQTVKKTIEYLMGGFICWVGILLSLPAWGETRADSLVTDYCLRVPEEEFLQPYREDPAFDYTETFVSKSDWWQRVKWWLMKHLSFSVSSRELEWLDWLLRVLIGAGLVFAIYKRVHSKYFFSSREKSDLMEEMKTLDGRPWSEENCLQMVAQALEKADFALAIRIHYWYILHRLDEQGWIHWAACKTNLSYGDELKDPRMKTAFKRLTYLFDCVCYGDFVVDAALYERLEMEFTDFRKHLKNEG